MTLLDALKQEGVSIVELDSNQVPVIRQLEFKDGLFKVWRLHEHEESGIWRELATETENEQTAVASFIRL